MIHHFLKLSSFKGLSVEMHQGLLLQMILFVTINVPLRFFSRKIYFTVYFLTRTNENQTYCRTATKDYLIICFPSCSSGK